MNQDPDSPRPKKGRWTKEEKRLFSLAYQWYGKDWKKLSEIITTRSVVQIRSHEQKYSKQKSSNSESFQVSKIFITMSAYEDLNKYIANACNESIKKYMELQQGFLCPAEPNADITMKMQDAQFKYEVDHT